MPVVKLGMVKLYLSERWLRRKYVIEKLSEDEIAEIAGVNRSTINRALHKFKIKKHR